MSAGRRSGAGSGGLPRRVSTVFFVKAAESPASRLWIPDADVQRLIALTCSEPPGEVTHWTGRAMAKVMGVSLRAVQRIWKAHKLQPHRLRTFKRSNDPDFIAKLEDIVGLYMAPGSRRRPVDRREVPDPGARSHPARPAAEARQMRNDHPRLQTQRHHHAVRRSQHSRRHGDRPMHAKTSSPGVHPLSQCRRARGAGQAR